MPKFFCWPVIIDHYNFFFILAHKTHKKQLHIIIYQGARFVQVTVSCSLQQHKHAKSLERNVLKYQNLKFLLNSYFFELVNCTVINCTICKIL